MKSIRTLIVSHEDSIRNRLANELEDVTGIYISALCQNGKDAVNYIKFKTPDLVILDIDLPDLDGFEVMYNIVKHHLPDVIFILPSDNPSIPLLDQSGLDYIIKEESSESLAESAIYLLGQRYSGIDRQNGKNLKRFIQNMFKPTRPYLIHIPIKSRGFIKQIPARDIWWIEADGNYISIHLENKRYLYRYTMNAIEKELIPDKFIRIHRSYIVNAERLDNIQYLNNNEFRFYLKNRHIIISGRKYMQKVQSFLSKTEIET